MLKCNRNPNFEVAIPGTRYQGLLKHIGGVGGFCVHPEGGQVMPTDDTLLVLWYCDIPSPERIQFALRTDGRLVHVAR